MQASFSIGPFLLPLGVKDKPFKGEFEHIIKKKLPGGETVHSSTRILIYQAKNGRRRLEEYANDRKETEPRSIIIYNPPARRFIFLDVESKSFFSDSLTESSSTDCEKLVFSGEDIGVKVIEGRKCRGYQVKRHANDNFEYWISEELEEIIQAKIITENEEHTLRLFNIERSEPANPLFVIPENYKPMKTE